MNKWLKLIGLSWLVIHTSVLDANKAVFEDGSKILFQDDETIDEIVASLEGKSVVELSLRMGYEDAIKIANLLRRNKTLTKLYLANTQVIRIRMFFLLQNLSDHQRPRTAVSKNLRAFYFKT